MPSDNPPPEHEQFREVVERNRELATENSQLRAVLSGFVNWTAAYKSGCPCTNCTARTLLGDYDH